MDVSHFVQPIVLIVCYIIGQCVKTIFKNFPTKYLPYLMGAIGMVLCPLLTWQINPAIIAEGLISGWASSGGYDALKALIDKTK